MIKAVALLFALLLVEPTQNTGTPQSHPVVFTHAAVIDVAADEPRRALKADQTVIITGNRITTIGRTGGVEIPSGAQVIDATGQFLIPGLWDMHIHAFGNWNISSELALFLGNGVTGVRDMGSNLERILELRQEIASGSRLGPRMVVSGPSVFGLSDERRPISPDEARGEVRRRKQAGVDFVKLYSYLSPAAFFAAIDEAEKQDLPAAGHVPFEVRASDAAKAGLNSIEHLEGVVIESTDLEDGLREEIALRIRDGKQGIQVPQIELDQTERYRDSYNPQRLQWLSALFGKYHTWHAPTLISPEASWHVTDVMKKNSFAGYPNLRYVPKAIEDSWTRALTSRFSPEQMSKLSVYAACKRVIAAAMHRAGVQFLAGTDAAGPGQVPGFSLHDELALLVQVGLSPLEALQTTTINPGSSADRKNSALSNEESWQTSCC